MRPAWVVPTLAVAVFAVVVFIVRVVGQEDEQPAFPTHRVPQPTASATDDIPSRPDQGLALTPTGLGPHRFGDAGPDILRALPKSSARRPRMHLRNVVPASRHDGCAGPI